MTRGGTHNPCGLLSKALTEDTCALAGNIARMSLASVLQLLELGRHSGVLVCSETDARTSECTFQEGRIVGARYQHLSGPEAVVAMLGLASGWFAFSTIETEVADMQLMSASPLIMEAVRLEDEYERFSAGYPGDDFTMRLQDPHEFPTDPMGCGADLVTAVLAAREGATVRELMGNMALAPIKVRLAAAWLGFTGRLRASGGSRQGMPAFTVARLAWFQQLMLRFSGGLRVVVALDPRVGTHEVIENIKTLAKELDSGPAWMSVGPDGTSMARVRPRSGGLLSIACVPRSAEHMPWFERLASTSDLVLVCGDQDGEDTEPWRNAASSASVMRVPASMSKTCLIDALAQLESELEQGPVSKPRGLP